MKFFRFLLYCCAACVLGGCSGGGDDGAVKTTHDLLRELPGYLQASTQVIDFRKDAPNDDALLQGWSPPAPKITWANALVSSVSFYYYGAGGPLDLDISCRTLRAPDGAPQTVAVRLNDAAIGEMLISPGKLRPVRLTLPAEALQTGQNVLEFHFAYTTNLPMSNLALKTARPVAAAFEKIVFHANTHLAYADEPRALLQQTNSAWSVFAEFPAQVEFDLTYHADRQTAIALQIIQDDHLVTTLNIPSKRRAYRKRVTLPAPGVYELRMTTSGGSTAPTRWEQIHWLTDSPEPTVPPASAGFAKQVKPDIILYVVDTLRADHVGCYGYQRNTTPQLDAFARENTLFRHAYAPDSWTRASAASILTGLLPQQHQTIGRDAKLPENLVTLAEILQGNGYYTAAFIANGNLGKEFGFQQGFQKSVYFPLIGGTNWHCPSDQVNRELLPFLRAHLAPSERQPLFLLVWTVDPHDPYIRREEVKDLFDINQYEPIDTQSTNERNLLEEIRKGRIQPTASQIEYLKALYDQEIYLNDLSFGNLLETLKSMGRYDDALILFTADHGEEFFDHGGVGHGITLYNEMIQIPFVLKAPAIQSGTSDGRVQLIDIYPTLLDLLGLDAPYALDGQTLANAPGVTRTLYFEQTLQGNDLKAILASDRKLIYNKKSQRFAAKQAVPVWELYALEDQQETKPLKLTQTRDFWRRQQLQAYAAQENTLGILADEVEMTPELDQKLRDLGYVK